MPVYLYTSIFIYLYACIPLYLSISICLHVPLYTSIPLYLHTSIPPYFHTSIPPFLYTSIPPQLHTSTPPYLLPPYEGIDLFVPIPPILTDFCRSSVQKSRKQLKATLKTTQNPQSRPGFESAKLSSALDGNVAVPRRRYRVSSFPLHTMSAPVLCSDSYSYIPAGTTPQCRNLIVKIRSK